jgi:hypothetical protein
MGRSLARSDQSTISQRVREHRHAVVTSGFAHAGLPADEYCRGDPPGTTSKASLCRWLDADRAKCLLQKREEIPSVRRQSGFQIAYPFRPPSRDETRRFELLRGGTVLGVVTLDTGESDLPWFVGRLKPSGVVRF